MIREKEAKKTIKINNIGVVGRRKAAVARVWLSKGTGNFFVNTLTEKQYFSTDITRQNVLKSLEVCQALKQYDIKVNVYGGGKSAQSDAIRLGVARALVKDNEAFRVTLREHGFLTVDARNKERKKPGQKAARRKFQFVKR